MALPTTPAAAGEQAERQWTRKWPVKGQPTGVSGFEVADVQLLQTPPSGGELFGLAAFVVSVIALVLGVRKPRARFVNRWVRAQRAEDGRTVLLEKRSIARVTESASDGLHVRLRGDSESVRVRDSRSVRKALNIRSK